VTSDFDILPPLVVAAHSPRWTSLILKNANRDAVTTQWFPGIDAALKLAAQHSGCAMIVELPKVESGDQQQLERMLAQLGSLVNNPWQMMIFVVGDAAHEPFRESILRRSPVQLVTSVLDFDALWARSMLHLKNHRIRDLSVEQWVEARFPFA